MTLYTDIDPQLCQWMGSLVDFGILSHGDVVSADVRRLTDLSAYDTVHLCAGVGCWEEALHLAGWGLSPVWTVSCPCQPFSAIGARRGTQDDRHIWPAVYSLIRRHRPPVVFGEQVASPDGLAWLDGVWTDMEAAGYTFEAVDLSAACLGAPHIRQRLYWVGYTERPRLEGYGRDGYAIGHPASVGPDSPTSVLRAWDRYEPLACVDGNRRVQPGTFPVVNGTVSRVGRLRAYGNALVPQLAALFIRSFMESG